MAQKLKEVAAEVMKSAATVKAEEELFADAPDHFLDALLSVLMTDPVKLPSSGQVLALHKKFSTSFGSMNLKFIQVVDRPIIARHLLSDQTDPFTRSPLTMDLVVPQPG